MSENSPACEVTVYEDEGGRGVSVIFVVGLPAEVLDDHGVGAFVAETGGGLHEVEVAVVLVVREEVVLHLQVHFLQLYVNVLDLLQQGLVLDQLQLLAPQLVLLHLRQVQPLYPLPDLPVYLLVRQPLQVRADLHHLVSLSVFEQGTVLQVLLVEHGDFLEGTAVFLGDGFGIEVCLDHAVAQQFLRGDDTLVLHLAFRRRTADLVHELSLLLQQQFFFLFAGCLLDQEESAAAV